MSWKGRCTQAVAVTVAMAGVCAAAGLPTWAEESEEVSPGAPDAEPYYQPVSSPSGNIIGYKPIPNAMLESIGAAPMAPMAVSSATPAYPPMESPIGAVSAPASPPGLPQTGLPASYQTGIMIGEGLYTLGRDDVMRISVRNQPEFSGDFPVGYDGRIQYNYLDDIPVAGLTKYEVQQVLEKLLQQYVRVPVVNVQIVAYNSKVVYVIGEVNRPGKFIMRGDAIKLREAILAAGLPNPRAAISRVHVIKPDLNDPAVRVINLKRILYKGKLKDDVDLAAGEIVVVPSTVMSKVNDFLANLLSPVTRVGRMAALAAL